MRYIILLLSLFFCSMAPAATLAVYPNGEAIVSIPINQYINVYGNANVYQQVGGPANNLPTRYAELTGSPISSIEYSFGPFTSATSVKIAAGPVGTVWYSVSTLGVPIPCEATGPRRAYNQMAPATATVTATLLASDLLSGIIVGTPTATGATAVYTMPTGTLLDAGAGLGIGQGFEWSVINLALAAADTITVTAGSGNTLVGSGIVPSSHASTGGVYGNAARFFSRKTAANTFITYRIH